MPEAKARLMNTIATTYLKLGLHKQAASWWRRAIDLRRTVLRNDDVALATSHASLAHALERDGRYAEADGHFRTALSTLRRVSPRPDREFVDVLIQYGGYRQNIGEYGAGGSCNRSRTLSPSGVRERRRGARTVGRIKPWRGFWRDRGRLPNTDRAQASKLHRNRRISLSSSGSIGYDRGLGSDKSEFPASAVSCGVSCLKRSDACYRVIQARDIFRHPDRYVEVRVLMGKGDAQCTIDHRG